MVCTCLDEHLAFDTTSSHGQHRIRVRSIYVLEYHDVFYYVLQLFRVVFDYNLQQMFLVMDS